MSSEIYSTKEKPMIKVLPIKRNPKWWKNNLLSMTKIHVVDLIDELRQLYIIMSWSTVNRNLFKRGPVAAISWASCFWSTHQALDGPLIRMRLYWETASVLVLTLGRDSLSQQKKIENKNSLESASDQTSVLSKVCAQNCLWSDRPRPTSPLLRQDPDHCPDKSALEVFSRPCNSSAPRTCVRSKMVWSEVTSVWPSRPGISRKYLCCFLAEIMACSFRLAV